MLAICTWSGSIFFQTCYSLYPKANLQVPYLGRIMSQLREPPATLQTQKPYFTKSQSSRDSCWASCPGLCWAGLSHKVVHSRRVAQEEGWRNVVQQLCQEGGHRYSLTGPRTENIRAPAFRSLTRKHTAFPGKLLFGNRYYFSQWLYFGCQEAQSLSGSLAIASRPTLWWSKWIRATFTCSWFSIYIFHCLSADP